MSRSYSTALVVLLSLGWKESQAFLPQITCPKGPSSCRNSLANPSSSGTRLWANEKDGNDQNGNQKYRNVATEFLSNFMMSDKDTSSMMTPKDDPLAAIDFKAPKQPIPNLETLAAALDYELYQAEWFVTGKVNPVYFADTFRFQDPDVTLDGIENYAKGVRTIFDQDTSRAEIIETVVNPDLGDNVITCKWRLSGKANIGPAGLVIKPYIVYSDFTVQDGLIVRQEDRFSLPPWDILLSSLFPFLIGKVRTVVLRAGCLNLVSPYRLGSKSGWYSNHPHQQIAVNA
eukprot:scaffold4510_cov183-Amphora_coffeaeformis.AAC.101